MLDLDPVLVLFEFRGLPAFPVRLRRELGYGAGGETLSIKERGQVRSSTHFNPIDHSMSK